MSKYIRIYFVIYLYTTNLNRSFKSEKTKVKFILIYLYSKNLNITEHCFTHHMLKSYNNDNFNNYCRAP